MPDTLGYIKTLSRHIAERLQVKQRVEVHTPSLPPITAWGVKCCFVSVI